MVMLRKHIMLLNYTSGLATCDYADKSLDLCLHKTMQLFHHYNILYTQHTSLVPTSNTIAKKHFTCKSHSVVSSAGLRCHKHIKTQPLSSRFVPGPVGQPGRVWGTVLPGVGVTIPQGSGLSHGLSVGWVGQHCGPGSSQVHSALR